MRIFDEKANKSIDNVTILLKKTEAIQLMGYLEELLSDNTQDEHYHIESDDYLKEITIALYNIEKLNIFSERYKTLIINDE